ncbi:hypothetical protein HDU96_002381, partial [Phlyctochytrium bullatum]
GRDRSRPPPPSQAASGATPLYVADADTIAALKASIDIAAYGKERGVTVQETTQVVSLLARPAPPPALAPPPAPTPPPPRREPSIRNVGVSGHQGRISHNLGRVSAWNDLLPWERQYATPFFCPEVLLRRFPDNRVEAYAYAADLSQGQANDVRNSAFQGSLFACRLPEGQELLHTPAAKALDLEKFSRLRSLRCQKNAWIEDCCSLVLPVLQRFLRTTIAKFKANPNVPLSAIERDALLSCAEPPRYTFGDDGTGIFTFAEPNVDRSFLEPLRQQLLPPSGPPRARSSSSRRSRSGRSRSRRPVPAVDADGDLDLIGNDAAATAADDTALDPIVVDDDGDVDLVGGADDADAVDVDAATAADAPAVSRASADDSTGRLLAEAAARARQFADATESSSGRRTTSTRSSPQRPVSAARAAEGSTDLVRRPRYNQPPPLVAPVAAPPPPPPPLYEPGDTAAGLIAYWSSTTPDRSNAASSLRSPSGDSVSSLGLNGLTVRSPAASGVPTTSTAATRRTPAPGSLRNPSPPADAELPPAALSPGRTPSPPPPPLSLPAVPTPTKSSTASSVPAVGIRSSSSRASPRSLTPPVRGASSAPNTTTSRKARRAESRQDSPDLRHTSTRGGSGFSVRPRTSASSTASPVAGRSGASTPSGRRVDFQVKPRAR